MTDDIPATSHADFGRVMADLSTRAGKLPEPMERFLAALGGAGDPTSFLTDDVEMVDWTRTGQVFKGKAEVIETSFGDISTSTPDYGFDLLTAAASGDLLLVCGFFHGTFTGDLPSYEATNRRVRWEARDIYGFRGEKVDRIWWANDTFTVKRMLGAPVDHTRFWD